MVVKGSGDGGARDLGLNLEGSIRSQGLGVRWWKC